MKHRVRGQAEPWFEVRLPGARPNEIVHSEPLACAQPGSGKQSTGAVGQLYRAAEEGLRRNCEACSLIQQVR